MSSLLSDSVSINWFEMSHPQSIHKHHNQALATLAGIRCAATGCNIPTPALQVRPLSISFALSHTSQSEMNYMVIFTNRHHIQSARELPSVTSDRATTRKYAPALWNIDPFVVTEWNMSMFVWRHRKSAGI